MQDCGDCRGIKPMSHTLMIVGIGLLREGLGTNNLVACQVEGRQIIRDAIFAAAQRMEKHREKQDCRPYNGIYRSKKGVR